MDEYEGLRTTFMVQALAALADELAGKGFLDPRLAAEVEPKARATLETIVRANIEKAPPQVFSPFEEDPRLFYDLCRAELLFVVVTWDRLGGDFHDALAFICDHIPLWPFCPV